MSTWALASFKVNIERFHITYWRPPKYTLFEWVSQRTWNKTTDWGHRFSFCFSFWRRDGLPFYVVIQITRRPSRLAGQRQYLHFSVILRPWVLVRPWESNPGNRSADWANPAAVKTMKWRSCWCPKPFLLEWELGAEPFSYVTFFWPNKIA